MVSNEERLYRDIWKPKLERDGDEEPYSGGNLRIDLALRVIPAGRKLLDVGCGSGTLGRVLLSEGKYPEVHGLELSEEAVAKARERGLKAVIFNLNGGPFPYPDRVFDTVTCLAVIEHVFDPRALLDEVARVLAPGGMLLLDTPNMRYVKHLWSLIIRRRFPVTAGDGEDLRLAYDGGHLHYFTRADIEDLLRESGLAPVRFLCVLPPRLRLGIRGRFASTLSRLPGLGELLSAEIFVLARRESTGDTGQQDFTT